MVDQMVDDGPPDEKHKDLLEWAFGWIICVDPTAIRAHLDELRAQNPGVEKRVLANKVYSGTAWKAASAGAVLGLPSNPWTAVPAATLDLAAMVRLQVVAAGHVAEIHNPGFLDEEFGRYELLVPVFGGSAGSQVLRAAGIRGTMGITRQAIRRYLSKETLRAFRTIMLKYFGQKVTQRAVITKTLPVVGGLIGGTWNYLEVHVVGNRVIKYFEGEPLPSDEESPAPEPGAGG